MDATKKKNFAIRFAIIFIGIMLLFTFFSRSIFYYTTPKVIIEDIKSGFIKYELTANSVGYYSDEMFTIQPPGDMTIHVQDVLVSPGEKVLEGDILFSMTDIEINNIVDDLNKEISEVNTAKLEYEKEYNDEVERLNNEIAQLTVKYEEAKNRYDYAVRAGYNTNTVEERELVMENADYYLGKAIGDLEYIEDTGIVNGTSAESISKNTSYYERFLSMLVHGKGVVADGEFIVGLVYDQPSNGYSSSDIMLTLLPLDSKASLLLELNDYEINNDELPKCKISWNNHELEGNIDGEIAWGNVQYISIELEESEDLVVFDNNNETENVKCTITSEFYNIIIPNSALMSVNKVYVLTPKASIWGETYTLEERVIVAGETNGYSTAVMDGISNIDMIVVGWDRAIKDGDTVMLPIR